jgi:flagellar basal body-associated protein FliL
VIIIILVVLVVLAGAIGGAAMYLSQGNEPAPQALGAFAQNGGESAGWTAR